MNEESRCVFDIMLSPLVNKTGKHILNHVLCHLMGKPVRWCGIAAGVFFISETPYSSIADWDTGIVWNPKVG